jgi:hypothetical protein
MTHPVIESPETLAIWSNPPGPEPTAAHPVFCRPLRQDAGYRLALYLDPGLSLEELRRLATCSDMSRLIRAGMDALKLP